MNPRAIACLAGAIGAGCGATAATTPAAPASPPPAVAVAAGSTATAPIAEPPAAAVSAPAPPRELAYPSPLMVAPVAARLGKVEVQITPCRFDLPVVPTADPNPNGGLAVDASGRVYVLASDGTIRRFTVTPPCDLRLDPSFATVTVPARQRATDVSVDAADVLYVTRLNQRPLRIVPDGTQAELCGINDEIRTAPDAVATVVDGVRVAQLQDDCAGDAVTLAGWTGYTPDRAWPLGDAIAFVNNGGDNVPIDYHTVRVHTPDGKHRVTVGTRKDGPQQIGGAAVVWACGTGICVGDRGHAGIRVWTRRGRFVGAIELWDVFSPLGFSDARPIDAVAHDGASLVLLATGRVEGEQASFVPLLVRVDGLAEAAR